MLAALVGPTGASLALAHSGDLFESLASARTVAVACGALVACGMLLGHARLAGNDHSQWLATALGVFAVTGLARGGYGLTHPDAVREQTATTLVGLMLLTAVLWGLLSIGAHSRVANPLPLGIVLAVLFVTAQQVALTRGVGLDDRWAPWLVLPVVTIVVALAGAIHRLDALPVWARTRFSLALVLGTLSGVVLVVEGPFRLATAVVALLMGVCAATLAAATAAALLRLVLTEGQVQLTALQVRLAAAEESRRADSARLHDINTLVGGIASASRLIQELPPSLQRSKLEVMVQGELDRLQRLLAGRSEQERRRRPAGADVDLDEVIGRIALSHQARGRGVTWATTGARVRGDADDLAELLDILVDNAARHGTPDDIMVSACSDGELIELAVHDRGPGVPPAVRETMFSWGSRGPRSDGLGIGLHTAATLATRLGGRLRLDDSAPGARFVLTVPDPSRTLVHKDLVVAGR